MYNLRGPAGLVLVGAVFIYLVTVASADGGRPDIPDLQAGLLDAVSHDHPGSDIGILRLPNSDTVCFPWASREAKSGRLSGSAQPHVESIHMSGSVSERLVPDLKSMNSVRSREILYDELQDGGPGVYSNSLAVRVAGNAAESQSWEGEEIEDLVDRALASGAGRRFGGATPGIGNRMEIEVSGITVSAINTVPGGSAVATSNIVIKPVQIIIAPPEVQEKLG